MHFLKIVDMKRRDSLHVLPEDLKQRSALGIEDIPPVVEEILDALSLKPEINTEGETVNIHNVPDTVEKTVK